MNISDNLNGCKRKNHFFLRYFGVRVCIIFITDIFFPHHIFAAAVFDVTAAGKAMFNPIITFIDAWYGTGIFAAGVGGAVVASGDLRTRAMGFGIGSVVAGLTLLGVKAGFNVKIVMLPFSHLA